jgi:hypothetical protein
VANLTQFESGDGGKPAACAVCEAMLPDAVDGLLLAEEKRAFDAHVAGCVACSEELEGAQRGAAWLAMLKSQTPEVPAGLLTKILESTTVAPSVAPVAVRVPAAAPAWAISSLWRRAMGAFRLDGRKTTFQPRLAMTAAMAFFSIALTLNLTGVRLTDLHASDFTPSGMQRKVSDMSASATRSFQNMRVVYQVESKVSELRGDERTPLGADREPAESAPQPAAPVQKEEPKQQPPDQKVPQGHSDLMMPKPAVRDNAAPRKVA